MSKSSDEVTALWPTPSNWGWTVVDAIGKVSLGRQRSPVNHKGLSMRPYVRAANITWNGWNLSDVKEMNFDDADFKRFCLELGDVLVNEGSGSANEVGKPAIWQGQIKDCCFQNTLVRVQPKACTPEYLYSYFLFSALTERFVSKIQGVNIYHIGKDGLANFPLPVPPLAEQRRIMTKIESLSAKSKRSRDHLDHVPRLVEKYKQTILAAAFRGDLTAEWRTKHKLKVNYSVTEISGLANVVTGSTPPTEDKARFFGGSIPFFKPTDLDAGYHVRNARNTLTKEGAAVSRPLPQSSVLVTCIGATIGKTGFARVACCTNQQINGLVPDLALVIPEWLYWMVVSPKFQQSILDNASATTLPIINKGRFERLSLPRPPLDEQREIVRRIERALGWIDRIAHETGSARKMIDHLDQAILAKAFCGELIPQDPTDEPASVLLERIRAERRATLTPRGGNEEQKASETPIRLKRSGRRRRS